MRMLAILLLMVPLCSAAANPAVIAFKHECANMTQSEDGFGCDGLDGNLLRLNVSDWKGLDDTKREHYNYRLNAFLVRYFQLGGRNFMLSWSSGANKYCSRPRGKFTYSCWDR